MDHALCTTIILSLGAAVAAVAGWAVKKDKECSRHVNARIRAMDRGLKKLEGLHHEPADEE